MGVRWWMMAARDELPDITLYARPLRSPRAVLGETCASLAVRVKKSPGPPQAPSARIRGPAEQLAQFFFRVIHARLDRLGSRAENVRRFALRTPFDGKKN